MIDAARRRATDAAGCDAAAVVADRVAFWSVLAEDTDRDVRTDLAAGPLPVAAGRADLEALVDALLGNVFAHTPDGTGFAVRLGPRPGGGARLLVADAGPGLRAGADVLRRGASGGGSTGLGLDIARRTAEQAGGGLTLGRSAAGGLAVTVDLGPVGRPGPPGLSRGVRATAARAQRAGRDGGSRRKPHPERTSTMTSTRVLAALLAGLTLAGLGTAATALGSDDPAAAAPVTVVAQTRTTSPTSSPTPTPDVAVADRRLTADEAVSRAVAHLGGGTATKVEWETEHGRAVWEVDVRRDSRITEVHVDTATGSVTRVDDDGRGRGRDDRGR